MSAQETTQNITELLRLTREGDQQARNQLFDCVYPKLKGLARRHMVREGKDHVLQPTALVHEAFIRLSENQKLVFNDRLHFYSIASECMRRILVDFARSLRSRKRWGEQTRVEFVEGIGPATTLQRPDEILAIDQALTRLASLDPRQARIVEMRFFGGLTEEEIAEVEGLSSRTVKRDWKLAKAYLLMEMEERTSEGPE